MNNIEPSYIQRIIGVTSFKREQIWTGGGGGLGGGLGLIETYRVGSVADIGYKYMFVTVNDIKRIKYHLYASYNIKCECKRHFAPK